MEQENWSRREIQLLQSTKLFAGIGEEKLCRMLSCLHARRARFGAGDLVVREGDAVHEVGIVLAGQACALRQSSGGVSLTVSFLEPGSLLGVLLAASRDRKSPVSVQAAGPLDVLFLPAQSLNTSCEKDCPEHRGLRLNFLDSVAEKSLVFNDRIDCLTRRSVREKVMAYLAHMAAEKGSREFAIPLDRSALAEYLNVERSALSRELSRMRKDGLIQCRKNTFKLL